MSGSTRYTVADLLAQKGRRQLIMLYVEPRTFEALLGALGEDR